MGYIMVRDFEGAEHRLPAKEGWRIMEIIREHGLPMKAECGGCCSCATCHIYVGAAWSNALDSPSAEELGMLDFLPEIRPNSRLACQIFYTPTICGLEIALAAS
jgi:ferredoxin, 2Fe-2S